MKKQLSTNCGYPVYQNSLTPLGFYDHFNCPKNTTYVISAGAAGEIGYSNVPFWAADDCLHIECPKYLNSRFLYYALMCQQKSIYSKVRKASIPRLSKTVIENIIIPLPSVEEQNRIVDILDRFDALCNDISAGLPAEIEARQKQYEHYRDKLLTFKELYGDKEKQNH